MLRLSHQSLRRYLTAGFVIFVLLLLLNFATIENSESELRHALSLSMGAAMPGRRPSYDSTCRPDLSHLREQYLLTPEINYQKRCLRGVRDVSVDRYAVENISTPLIRQGDIIHPSGGCRGWMGREEPSCEPIEVDVPPPFPDRRYPHMLFGVATTFDRLQESKPQFAHWLARSGATLVAVVIDAKYVGSKVDELTRQYREEGMNLVIVHPWNELVGANEQHFTILRDLFRRVTPYTEWVGILDDDTFFPSLYSLSNALAQYDPKLPAYLGGLSESFWAIELHGVMAYGGAGVFLSVPLLAELDPVIEECLMEGDIAQGDGLLRSCIYKKTTTKFTMVAGLQQVDMRGDVSGFFESGRLPLSLHHWKSWYNAPVDKMAMVSHFCGSCFLQRWRLGPDTVLTNGYSIAVYEQGTRGLALNEIEGTWDGSFDLDWSVGPLRPKMDRSLKKSYLLLDAEQVGNNMRQLYVHWADSREPPIAGQTEEETARRRDEIIELYWEF